VCPTLTSAGQYLAYLHGGIEGKADLGSWLYTTQWFTRLHSSK